MQVTSTSHNVLEAYSPGDLVEWQLRGTRVAGVVFCKTPTVDEFGIWTRSDWDHWMRSRGLRCVAKAMNRPATYCYDVFRRKLPWGGYLLFRNFMSQEGKFVISTSTGQRLTKLGCVPSWASFCRQLEDVVLMRDRAAARSRYVSFFDGRSPRFAFRLEDTHVERPRFVER